MTAPRELVHFLLLPPKEQAAAIRRLAASGMSVQTIATATRLSVEQIRQLLAEPESG
jgi:DNA invertase Pin-like site-specific DNA recombinase